MIQQVNDLNKKIREAEAGNRKAKIDEFKKMEWCKDTEVTYEIGIGLYGSHAYNLILNTKHDSDLDSIIVYGENKEFYDNINYGKNYSFCSANNKPYLTTLNKGLLIEFLRKFKFKKISYNQDEADVYAVLREVS